LINRVSVAKLGKKRYKLRNRDLIGRWSVRKTWIGSIQARDTISAEIVLRSECSCGYSAVVAGIRGKVTERINCGRVAICILQTAAVTTCQTVGSVRSSVTLYRPLSRFAGTSSYTLFTAFSFRSNLCGNSCKFYLGV